MPAGPLGVAFFVTAMVVLAGCADGDGAKASPSSSATPQPTPPRESIPEPAANLTPSDVPVAAKAPGLSVRFNGTGDLVIRFLLVAEEGSPCEVEAAVAFTHSGRENTYSILEESSGARFTYGGEGTYVRAGPIDTASASEGSLWAWQSTISGESWGSTQYTVGVNDLTWWDNEYTGPGTFRLDASCDGAFEVCDVTASREVRMFSQAALGSGAAVAYSQSGAVAQGEWDATMAGDDIHVVVLSNAEALRMVWSTPSEEVTWDGAQQEGGGASILRLEGPSGMYGTTVDMAGLGGFAAVVADLPPVDDLQAYLDSL